MIGSAGNAGRDNNTVAEYAPIRNNRPNNLMVVGASDQRNQRAIFRLDESSNWGSEVVCIFAPGMAINTAEHANFGGTSAAAPVVAGVAALMLSANPRLSPQEIISIIRSTATRNVHHVIRDHSISGGIVDAYAALRAVVPFNPTPSNTISSPMFLHNNRTVINQNPFPVNLVIQYDVSGDGDTFRYFLRTGLQPGHGFTIGDSYFSHWGHPSGFTIWFEGNGRTSGSLWWS